MRLKIYIENQLIDLFNDETIELTSAIANTEDITKMNTDYTKTFTVPASATNNKLFKHYYNADIDNTFDARTKKDCRIELDGFPFRTGKMRLEKVSVKQGRAHAYTINFWGNLVNFKDLIKDDELTALDFSVYDHIYNFDSVKEGLVNGLFHTGIIYSLFSQKRQYMYSSDPANDTNTDNLVNIAHNGQPRGVRWNELKPSVKLLIIIEAIEAKYDITFSRDFFGRQEFTELYMWLNNSTEGTVTEQKINWVSGGGTEGFQVFMDLETDTWNIPFANPRFKYTLNVFPAPGYETVPYKIICKKDGLQDRLIEAVGVNTEITSTFAPAGPCNYTFHIACNTTFEYTAGMSYELQEFPFPHFGFDSDLMVITDTATIKESLPKIKIIDFLKGLFNMFKLVAIPDESGNVYVNNIDDYYREGKIYDISKHVDAESYDVQRGTIFNTFNFKFQEPTTILNNQFKINTGVAYGDAVTSLADAEGVPLDGGALELQLPFETVLFERLKDIQTNYNTFIQYGLVLNSELKAANPKPVIHYNNRIGLVNKPITLLDQSGAAVKLEGLINTPSHTLGFEDPAFALLWGAEFSTWNGVIIQNSLFNNYWRNYVSAVFNIKKRLFKFKAQLPTHLLTKIALNDVFFIKERYYRVNDFTVNLMTNEASLTLMNTFENNFGLFRPAQQYVNLTATAQAYAVYVSNGSTMNFDREDVGFGIDWASASNVGSNALLEVTENTTGSRRIVYINVDNGAGKTFQLYLTQEA